MTKVLFIIFLISINCFAEDTKSKKPTKDDKAQDLRVKIGPTVASPVESNKNLYFLATTGVLYKANYNLDQIEDLFLIGKSSVSGVSIYGDTAYFGEGLHEDKESILYAFDLKKKEVNFKIKLAGHIEKEPVLKNDLLYVSMGPGGLGAIDLKKKSLLWSVAKDGSDIFHIDSTPIFYEGLVCVSSIYQFKGIVCFEEKTGKVILKQKLKYSAKGELGLSEGVLFGHATEANLLDSKWDVPSIFFIYDLKKRTLVKEVDLRGFNFFSPALVNSSEAFINISTGDLITISLKNGTITYVSEFPEPFLSNSFVYNNQFCAIGVMGKLLCYKKVKNSYALSFEKRFFESPIGRIGKAIEGKIYFPSRMGFFSL